MRIRKGQVHLPLSSLLPDLYFYSSPTATAHRERDGGYLHLLIKAALVLEPFGLWDENGDYDDVDVKSSTDALRSKNVNPLGESDSSTQDFKKNDKMVTSRKRRRFTSFEGYEEQEEEEEASVGNKGKKKKGKKRSASEEGSGCSRVNGRGWRCCQETRVGYSLCEHHLGKVRSMNKSRGGRGGRGGGGGSEEEGRE